MALTRSQDYTAGTVIASAEVDAEMNELYGAIGTQEFTEQNFVTNDESVTSSLDAIDQQIQDMIDGTQNYDDIIISDAGTLLVGDTTARAIGGVTPSMQVNGTGANDSVISIQRASADASGPFLIFGKGRDALGTYTTCVSDNDVLGSIIWSGSDGADMATQGATIFARINGAPSENDYPTELVFGTTQDGASTPTTWGNWLSTGQLQIGLENPTAVTPFVTNCNVSGGYSGAFYNDGDNIDRHGIKIQGGSDAGGDSTYYVDCFDGNGDRVGYLTKSGGTFQDVNVSDERLKKNIRDTSIDAVAIIKATKIRDYELIKTSETVIAGMVAQELLGVYDNAVSGRPGETEEYEATPAIGNIVNDDGSIVEENVTLRDYHRNKKDFGKFVKTKDPVMGTRDRMMGVANGTFVPVLIKAIQELTTRIEALEA